MTQPDDDRQYLAESAADLQRQTREVGEPYQNPQTGEWMLTVDDEPMTVSQVRELRRQNTAAFVHPRRTINE